MSTSLTNAVPDESSGPDGRVRPLSLVEGKVIELTFDTAGKTVLAAVAAFDSPAKAEGKDIIFMVCSDGCGREVQVAFADELAHGLTIQ